MGKKMENENMKYRKVACAKNSTRREFIADVCTSAIAVSTIGAGLAEEASAPKKQFPKGRYVDVHVHLGQVWNSRGVLDAKMLLEWMDANDISQAVVLPLISPESYFYPITPHWVLEQTKPHRDRLIPFCSVDPRSVNLGGYKGFLDILKRCVAIRLFHESYGSINLRLTTVGIGWRLQQTIAATRAKALKRRIRNPPRCVLRPSHKARGKRLVDGR